MKTHDYTQRYWGHDYAINRVIDGGQSLAMMGWGHGIEVGDYLIIQNGKDTTRYQVAEISYCRDPRDMWKMTATFAPR